MARIGLVWERGQGQSYARRFAPLAAALADAGHEPLMVVRDTAAVARALGTNVWPVLQAPWIEAPSRVAHAGASAISGFVDLQALHGMGDEAALRMLVGKWDALLDLLRLDLLLVENAPAATAAAFGRMPVVHLGCGAMLPAIVDGRFARGARWRSTAENERAVSRTLSVVLEGRVAAPPTPAGLFAGAPRLLYDLPEVDPYAAQRQPVTDDTVSGERRIGPLDPLPSAKAPVGGRHVFAYLPFTSNVCDPVLRALLEMNLASLELFVPGMPGGLQGRLRERGVTVHTATPDLEDVLTRASHVVHPAGVETSMAALAIGRPQFLVPDHMAQAMIAHTMVAAGLAAGLRPIDSIERLQARLREFFGHVDAPRKAFALAVALQQRPPFAGGGGEGRAQVVRICEATLERARGGPA